MAYVSWAEFQTPHEQIVLLSLRTAQYTKFQADEDYAANPGLDIVRVVVALKLNYSGPAPPTDRFKVVVTQAKSIEPRDTPNTGTCDPNNPNIPLVTAVCNAHTREILLHRDAKQSAPGKATVKVGVPFGQSVETKYNFDKHK